MHGLEKRKRAYQFGHVAEWACILLLWAKGYRILARRYRNNMGEVDLIAARGRTLAFIEVKARRDTLQGMEALKLLQRQRIGKACSLYLAAHPKYTGHNTRFDLMVIAPWRWPLHMKNAWNMEYS